MADSMKDKLKKAGNTVAEKATEAKNWVEEKAEEVGDWAKQKLHKAQNEAEEAEQKAKNEAEVEKDKDCGCSEKSAARRDAGRDHSRPAFVSIPRSMTARHFSMKPSPWRWRAARPTHQAALRHRV